MVSAILLLLLRSVEVLLQMMVLERLLVTKCRMFFLGLMLEKVLFPLS